LNWDDLRFFLAVADCGTLTAAAARLGVNHTTVARRVSALEKQSRVRLFDRSPDGYALTPAGAALAERAIAMRDAAADAERTLAAHDESLSGPLAITAPRALAVHVILPMLRRFHALYPDIVLRLVSSDEVTSLSRREADIAIRATRTPDELLTGRRLCAMTSTLYCRRELWREGHDSPGLIAIEGEAPPPDAKQAAITVSSKLEALEAARTGLGMAMLPCRLGDCDDTLMRVPGAEMHSGPDIWLLMHRDLKATPRVQAFSRFAADAFREEAPLFEGLTSPETSSRSSPPPAPAPPSGPDASRRPYARLPRRASQVPAG